MGKREDRLREERAILAEKIADGGVKEMIVGAWMHRTRRKQASFYQRLGELPDDLRRRYESLPDGRTIDVGACIELSDMVGVLVYRATKAGRRATLEDIRSWWAESQYKDLRFEPFWRALPESERREVEG